MRRGVHDMRPEEVQLFQSWHEEKKRWLRHWKAGPAYTASWAVWTPMVGVTSTPLNTATSWDVVLPMVSLVFAQSDRLRAIGTSWHHTGIQDLPLQFSGNLSVHHYPLFVSPCMRFRLYDASHLHSPVLRYISTQIHKILYFQICVRYYRN